MSKDKKITTLADSVSRETDFRERVEQTKKKRAEYDNRYSDNTGEESKKRK